MAIQSQLGINRTGTATSPKLTEAMVQGTAEFPPTHQGDEREISHVREDYVRDAEPLGTVPPPPQLTGMLKSAKQALTGKHPVRLNDKLGERLAFERTGTRLWEALL